MVPRHVLGPTQQNVFWSITMQRFLTWPSVSRRAVLVGVDAALAGTLLVALQNVVALGRGTEVAFTEW